MAGDGSITSLHRREQQLDPELLKTLEKNRSKESLAGSIVEAQQSYKENLRRAIVDGHRVDLLATHVLGLDCYRPHRMMLAFQEKHAHSLQLAFRGIGKTKTCTTAKVIWYLCVDPNLRIVLVSKTAPNAKSMLREIKQHLSGNQLLIELFGEFAPRSLNDPNIVWNDSEIIVQQRTRTEKESSITALGAESGIVSKHFDIAIIDDLVDEENSRTRHRREAIKTFYYKILDPTLEPPDPKVPHRGERHFLGTRYNPEDLYGFLAKNDLKGMTQVIPALTKVGEDGDGHPIYETPWPEKYSVAYWLEKRARQGPAIFDSQFQCDIESMNGGIFLPEWFDHEEVYYDTVPEGAFIWSGVDLAIGLSNRNDKFAHVTIARDLRTGIVYLIDYVTNRYSFSRQTAVIGERFKSQQPVRVGIEAVAYQAAQAQKVAEEYPEMKGRIVPVFTKTDKLTRAWRLTGLFESKLFRMRASHTDFVAHMVALRGEDSDEDDLFDAFEIAVDLSQRGARRRRSEDDEPHLL